MADKFIGLISGTSIDAVDAALVEFGDDKPVLLGYLAYPIDETIRQPLQQMIQRAENASLEQLTRLDVEVGRLFAGAVRQLLIETGEDAASIRAIGSHGQTVFHRPQGDQPTSLQIGDPNIIAELTGITTVADFRRRDMAAGGQGAPLVPAFHRAVFHSAEEDRAILNIGGIANLTLLPATSDRPVAGFDTGPGNTLLDQWCLRHQDRTLDFDAEFARQGQIDQALLSSLLADTYFDREPPKSTGREYFNLEWLDALLDMSPVNPADVQATLCALTAQSVLDALAIHAPATRRLIVCGGGVHNPLLMDLLAANESGILVGSSAGFGIDPDYVEAMAFAWLARQTMDGLSGNISSVTGACADRVLGGIYPAMHHTANSTADG